MADPMLRDWLDALPGGRNLSRDFCNEPVRVDQRWVDDCIAVVVLCGRLHGHEGACDPHGDPAQRDGCQVSENLTDESRTDG